MTKFIEVTDSEDKGKMLINVNKIIYVYKMSETKACIRYANSGDGWPIVYPEESFSEICEMLRNS